MVTAILVSLLCYGAAVAAAVIGQRRSLPFVYALSSLGGGVGAVAGVAFLCGGASPVEATLPIGLPFVGAHFRVDALSAYFLLVVNAGAAVISIYSPGYGRHG